MTNLDPPRTDPLYFDRAGKLQLAREWVLWFQSISTQIVQDGSDNSAQFEDIAAQIGAILEPNGLADLNSRLDGIATALAMLPSVTSPPPPPATFDLEDVFGMKTDSSTDQKFSFVPTFSGLTEVGANAKAGVITTCGPLVFVNATITSVAGSTSASTAGTTYMEIPYSVQAGMGQVSDQTGLTGTGLVVVSTNRLYLPAWVASTNTRLIVATLRRF